MTAVQRGSLGFGIVRSIDATRGRARLAELCELMAQDLGILLVPHHPESYSKLVAAFDSGEISIAWLPPIASSQLADRGRSTVLAMPVRRGEISYRATIIARKGTVSSLGDLSGKRMAWVDPDSSSGYLVPRLYLQGAGVDLTTAFAEERFLMSHANVVEAVISGRFDTGATYCSATGIGSSVRGPWGKADVHLVAMTGTIPNDTIVVAKSVGADVRSKVLRWLLDLRSPRAKSLCTDLFGADGFRVSSPEHFEPLRRMMIAARARGSLPPPA